MIQAGVPVIPGSKRSTMTGRKRFPVAARNRISVIVEGSSWRWKGMRVAADETELRHAFCTAQKEAVAAFGDGTMYLEHFVQRPRHIEFQILADKYGHVITSWRTGLFASEKPSKAGGGIPIAGSLRSPS